MLNLIPVAESARVLTRNALWNLLGQAAPLIVALVTIPVLIRRLGVERFGILTLAWMAAGYLSLFDLGLGRGLTQLVAAKLATGTRARIPALVWTAIVMMSALGVVGAVAGAALAPWLVRRGLQVPPELVAETIRALYLLALALPAVTVTAAFRGLLEATQRFGLSNALRLPLGIFNFVGPLVALAFSRRVDVLVAVLVAGRVGATVAHVVVCRRTMPDLLSPPSVDPALARPLLSFGGWMTVSNVVSPLMSYLDRFLVGALVSMSAVAYYVTPYEVVTKLWLIPGALTGVLFPAFAASIAADPPRAARLLDKGCRYVFLALFPLVLTLVVLAAPGLDLWLGAAFARHGARVVQWLSAGVLVNSLAQVAFAFVQGAGRPDVTAKLHVAELGPYLLVAWWAIKQHGIEGAAAVWFLRVGIDGLALFAAAGMLIDRSKSRQWILAATTLGLSALLLGAVLRTNAQRYAFLAASLAAFAGLAWRFLLDARERSLVRVFIRGAGA